MLEDITRLDCIKIGRIWQHFKIKLTEIVEIIQGKQRKEKEHSEEGKW